LVAGCKIKVQCKGGVGADSMLVVVAGERRGSLGMGFENMMHSWVMKWGVQQGLGVTVFRWLVCGKAKPREEERGCHHRLAFF